MTKLYMQTTQQYIQDNKERFLQELFDLLRIPSVSADPAYAGDVRKTAEAVAEHLTKAGADNVEVIETPGRCQAYRNGVWPLRCTATRPNEPVGERPF